MNKDLLDNVLNHNNFDAGVRGEWRKYNPYNPYIPERDKVKKEDLKVESLDDLFEEESKSYIEEKIDKTIDASNIPNVEPLEDEIVAIPEAKETPRKDKPVSLDELFDLDDEILPQGDVEEEDTNSNKSKQELTADIQKELEAKFDELFGPIDE